VQKNDVDSKRPLHKWREEKGREEDKKWKKERDLV